MTKDAKGYIFYEAKFRREPVTEEMIRTEIAQVEKAGFQCYKYGFFSRSGFQAKQAAHLILITLEVLYLLLLFLFAAVRPVLGRRASIVLLKADVKYG